MSLINQMLQELDARGNQAALGGVLQGQVRAVPQRRGLHPAWWLALVLACVLCAGGLWAWHARVNMVPIPRAASILQAPTLPNFSLKIDTEFDRQQDKALPVPAAMADIPAVASGAPTSAERAAPNLVSSSVKESAHSQAPVPAQAALPAPNPPSLQASPAVNNAPATPPAKAALPTVEGQQRSTRNAEPEPAAGNAKEATPVKLATVSATASVSESPMPAKLVKELTPRQLAENEYRKASGLIQQGRTTEAIGALEQALQFDVRHAEARQTLAALLIQSRRQDDAIRILREGLQLDASQSGLAMILARLQLERGELKPAIETLQRSLAHAGERADYLAFMAALLQRDGRHKDAIDAYAQALRKSPGNGVWWMGQGISLQAENRIPEAIEAYKRARAGNGLSAELKAFVEDRLNSL
jgi:MSHA biogenesis protein MshN